MAENAILRIMAEDDDLPGSEVTSTSFKGRLDLSDFAFKSARVVTLRRSPRILTPKLESTSPTLESTKPPTQKRSPERKRRADSLSLPSSASQSLRKKARSPSGYAPPSTYAHLPELPDILAPNLLCIFVGLNPGIRTATNGHAYSHPSNHFWKLLHSSGLTTRRLKPEEDCSLPELFSLGNTNIVARPTRNGAELSKKEMDDSVHILEEKIKMSKPEVVCIVGKSIWESIWRARRGKSIKKEQFKYGWQDETENMGLIGALKSEEEEEEDAGDSWKGAKVFVATSTSGLAATPTPAEKQRIWRELGVWVEQKRIDRAATTEQIDGGEIVAQQDA
jgi:G:T/U-mismatch repair DNA glycosylase